MIASRERKTPEQATSDCYYLSKLLDGKLIVNIVVYADESGTHDLSSKQDGSKTETLSIELPAHKYVIRNRQNFNYNLRRLPRFWRRKTTAILQSD
jgi:hypothetical protein